MRDSGHDAPRFRWRRWLFVVVMTLTSYPVWCGPACLALTKLDRADLLNHELALGGVDAIKWPLRFAPDGLDDAILKSIEWWLN